MTRAILQQASDRRRRSAVDCADAVGAGAKPVPLVDPLAGEVRLGDMDLADCPGEDEERQQALAYAHAERLVNDWWADPAAAQADWDAELAAFYAEVAADHRQGVMSRRAVLDGVPGVGSFAAAVEVLDGAAAWTPVQAAQAATVEGFVDELQDGAVSGFAALNRVQNHVLWLQLRCAEMVLRAWTGRTPSLPRKTRGGRTVMEDQDALTADAVAVELALAAGITPRRAAGLVDAATAVIIEERLPLTGQVLRDGRLDWARLRLIVSRTRDLSSDAAGAVEALVYANPKALDGGVGRFENALTAAILAVDADAEAKRRARYRKGRRVSVQTGEDGAARLNATGPGEAITAAYNGLDAAARYLRAHGDPRSLDQLRHDLLVTGCTSGYLPVPADLLPTPAGCTPTNPVGPVGPVEGAGGGFGRRSSEVSGEDASLPGWFTTLWPDVQVGVNVTISAETLMGLLDAPGILQGYGPIPADAIRDLAKQGTFRCIVTDTRHGTVLGVGKSTFTPGYTPGKRLKQFTDHAAPTCTGPRCHKPSANCDLDHRTPHAHGGATCDCNVMPLCRSCHRLKTAGLLVLRPSTNPDDPPGTMIWITRTGRDYTVHPHTLLPCTVLPDALARRPRLTTRRPAGSVG